MSDSASTTSKDSKSHFPSRKAKKSSAKSKKSSEPTTTTPPPPTANNPTSIATLESLLELNPFTSPPEDNREDENYSYEQLKAYTTQIGKPPDNFSDYNLNYTKPETMQVINWIYNYSTHVKTAISQQISISHFSSLFKIPIFNPQTINPQTDKIMRFNPQSGQSLSDFINQMPSYYTIIVPQGNYECTTINFTKNINLIAEGQVSITSPKNLPAMKCDSSTGYIQGFIFQSKETKTPVVNITSGEVIFSKCSFIGSSGPATKVQFLSHAIFTDCDFKNSQEFVLSVTDTSIVQCTNCNFSSGKKAGVCLQNNKLQFVH